MTGDIDNDRNKILWGDLEILADSIEYGNITVEKQAGKIVGVKPCPHLRPKDLKK